MDTNPFANQAMPQQDPTLAQTKTRSVPGAMSNMVKALIAGNDQYKAANPTNVGSATSMTAPGAPMDITPPAAGLPPPAVAMAPGGGAPSPFDTGAPPMNMAPMPGMMQTGMGGGMPGMPNGIDPSMSALFSPIPG